MKKSELREIYKNKRKQLTEDEVRLKSLNLLQQLKETDLFEKEVFHVFLPMEKRKEVFTWFFIEFLRMKGKTIAVSKCNFETTTLDHFILEKDTVLKENHYGVPEPVDGKPIEPKQLDVVLVPLMISDQQNYRVGYGKGFYDRFLAECRSDVQTIGLNFFEPVDSIEDLNEYDVPLQRVVYP